MKKPRNYALSLWPLAREEFWWRRWFSFGGFLAFSIERGIYFLSLSLSLSRQIGGDDGRLARRHSMNKTRSESGNFFDRFLFNKMDGESSMVPAALVSSGGCNDGDGGWMTASRDPLTGTHIRISK